MIKGSEQQLLEARERRFNRLEIKRARVRQVECPECKADPLARCRTDAGRLRLQNHQERWDLAQDCGLVRQ